MRNLPSGREDTLHFTSFCCTWDVTDYTLCTITPKAGGFAFDEIMYGAHVTQQHYLSREAFLLPSFSHFTWARNFLCALSGYGEEIGEATTSLLFFGSSVSQRALCSCLWERRLLLASAARVLGSQFRRGPLSSSCPFNRIWRQFSRALTYRKYLFERKLKLV